MSELVVVTYPDVYRAGEVCAAIQRLHDDFLIEIEDIAYITREEDGKLKLHETADVTTTAAAGRRGFVRGTIWGGLVGLLFLNPLLGMVAGGAIGAAGGAASGRIVEYGITATFMKDIGEKVVPGTSALFILFRKENWEKVIDRIAEYGGVVMHSALSAEAEAKLLSALADNEPKAA
jgi:uncharacterized membrane protein